MEAFFVGPGKSVLENDEVLAEIQIPHLPPHTVGAHLKFGTRRGDVAIAGVSVLITLEGETCRDIKIALGAVGPTPFRAKSAEDILRGRILKGETNGLLAKAAQAASDESHPIDDLRGSAAFRKELVQTLVKNGLECALGQARA
jgi:carbon-monoxide dehydrogenase medium subunit